MLFLVLLQVIGSQMSKPDSVRLRIYWESGRKKPSEMSKNWLLLEESDFKKNELEIFRNFMKTRRVTDSMLYSLFAALFR